MIRFAADGRATRDGLPLSLGAVLAGLADDPALRAALADRLRAVAHPAFCWELPALTPAALDRPFECAFVDSPALARVVADPEPFREHFSDAPVAAFESLGRDAFLLAPSPRADDAVYAHLATFVRGAPASQVDALFAAVGLAVRARLGPRPLWLSTAGLGVSWLHVRLDTRPKYFRTERYRVA
jgi:hypothetical protein